LPFFVNVPVDYRALVGLQRKLKQEEGAELTRDELADFISYVFSLVSTQLEWHSRIRMLPLSDLWQAFKKEQQKKGRFQTPDVSEAAKKARM